MIPDNGSPTLSIDLRVLCTALGFTVAATQSGDVGPKERLFRARGFARLIEDFCRASIPEAFVSDSFADVAGQQSKFSVAERMAATITTLMEEKGGCVPQDLNTRGFSSQDIDHHWTMANALAHVKLNLDDLQYNVSDA